jgi:hypothetical protein
MPAPGDPAMIGRRSGDETDGTQMTHRRVGFWLGLLGVIVVIAVIAGPVRTAAPLDPRSAQGNGTKALVLLLRRLGATVDVSADAPGPDVDVTAVFDDQLSTARRGDIDGWMKAGGTVVVADPTSPLQVSAPVRASTGFAVRSVVDGPCPQAGFDDVGRLSTGGSDLLDLGPVGNRAVGCFSGGRNAYLLVTQPAGRGRLTGIGGAGLFTNNLLGADDNSVLAADLFLPKRAAHVRIMLRSPLGAGHRSLVSLIRPSVRLALFQLLVAFAVIAFWRGRRLGRPVPETHPVQLAGSELVVAVGNLLARTGRAAVAAGMLRQDLRRWLAARLGLGATAGPEQLADAATARTGIDRERLLALLEDRPLASDAELVALAQSIERARQEVMHG